MVNSVEPVDDTINELTDHAKLNARRELQLSQRNELREIADRYDYGDDEVAFLGKQGIYDIGRKSL
ncbi:hypothetical protein ES703_40454 [subsurface metagenome]